ncbi:MAG: hypothetical protein ACI8WB_000451 [Phenylobacterium sp.]|jgi:hypothetical protein
MEIIIRSIKITGEMPDWIKFVEILKNCLVEMGHTYRVIRCVDLYPDDPYPDQFSIFPHCRKQETPTGRLFYKEMYLKGLFTLDAHGWGPDHGASQKPPSLEGIGDDEALGLVSRLREQYFANGGSKIQQPQWTDIDESLKPYWLVPLQQEKDQVIKYHSTATVVEFVHLIADWAEQKKRNIVFKVHPADSTEEVANAVNARVAASPYLFSHSGSIHALIQAAMGVAVINSGTGFESLIHGSPVATFGACDYQWATFAMSRDNLDDIDNCFINDNPQQQMARYRFLYHYLNRHAFEINTLSHTITNDAGPDAHIISRVKAILQQTIDDYQAAQDIQGYEYVGKQPNLAHVQTNHQADSH